MFPHAGKRGSRRIATGEMACDAKVRRLFVLGSRVGGTPAGGPAAEIGRTARGIREGRDTTEPRRTGAPVDSRETDRPGPVARPGRGSRTSASRGARSPERLCARASWLGRVATTALPMLGRWGVRCTSDGEMNCGAGTTRADWIDRGASASGWRRFGRSRSTVPAPGTRRPRGAPQSARHVRRSGGSSARFVAAARQAVIPTPGRCRRQRCWPSLFRRGHPRPPK